MKTSRISLFFLLAIGHISVIQCSAQAPVKSGGYVSNEYDQLLKASKSPLKASKAVRPQSCDVTKDKNGVLIRTFYDLGEAGPVFKVANDGKISLVEGAAKEPAFQKIDSSSFALAYEGHPKAIFNFVADVGRYVGRTCLVGKYATKDGIHAVLTEKGEFNFGNAKKKYSVGLNYPPSFQRDYFIADSLEYGFTRSGDTLRLFDVTGGSLFEEGKMNALPSQILIQIQK
jgi:hypothetical protein